MKFQLVRESRPGKNPLPGHPRLVQEDQVWTLEVDSLEQLRDLFQEIMVAAGDNDAPRLEVDFLPHYEGTPSDCEGVLFICD